MFRHSGLFERVAWKLANQESWESAAHANEISAPAASSLQAVGNLVLVAHDIRRGPEGGTL